MDTSQSLPFFSNSDSNATEFERQAALLHAINESASLLQHYARSQNLSELLEKIVEQAVQLLNGSGGGFYLTIPDQRKVRCAVSYKTQRDYRDTMLNYGEGIAGSVALSGEPLIIDDYRTWSGRAKVFETEQPFRSVISAPVIWQGQVTGVLHVLDQNESRSFTKEELGLLILFANQAAIAVENARLLESERRRRQEAETLTKAATALTSSLNLNAVLDNILIRLAEVINYDSATVFLLENDLLYSQAARGLPKPDNVIGKVFPANNPLIQEIHQSRLPLILENAQSDPRFHKWGETEYVHSWMGIPMIIQDKIIGYVTCDNRQVGIYTPHDANLAQAFANQAAIAIENARLFEQSTTERSHLRLLYDISQEMASSLEPNEILARAISLTCKALNGLVGEALLYIPEENRLSLRAIYGRKVKSIKKLDARMNMSLGDGLAGWVAQSKQPVCVPDVNLDPHWLYIPGLDEDVHSAISSPIMAGDQLLGVLSVLHRQPAAFSTGHLDLLQIICQEVGLALSNARRYEEVRRRLAEITLIQNLAQTFSQRLEVQVLLDEVATQLAQKFGYPYVLIYLVEEDKLILKACYGCQSDFPLIPLSKGITGRAARTGQVALISDVTQDPDYLPCSIESVSELVVPIFLHKIVVGVISILSQQADQLTTQDRDLLEILAGQISIALENAFLYERLHKHAITLEHTVAQRTAELTELYNLSQEIGYPLSYQTLLQLVLHHLHKALGCELAIGCLIVDDRRIFMIETNRPISKESIRETRSLCIQALNNSDEFRFNAKQIQFEVMRAEDYDPHQQEIRSINSLTQAPILVGQKNVGYIMAGSEQKGAFDAELERVLTTFANQASSVATRLATILSVQQKQLDSLVEYLPVGVMFLDTDFRILVANPRGREFIEVINGGESPDQYLLKLGSYTIQELTKAEDSPELKRITLPIEIELAGPPKRIFAAQIQQAGSPPNRQDNQWVLMLSEITQEREKMTRIQSQERLATVGQLAAGIAHDFNNIMATILVYTDLMRYDTAIPPSSQEKLNVIHHQIQRASSLIRQILDFSRKSLMEFCTIDLLPLVKELDRMLARVLPETIRLELIYQPNTYWINGDPTRLQQVFMNLALNARDAMLEGGKLSFELTKIHIQPDERPPIPDMTPGNWIRVTVTDTGVGISPEVREHIFEPFYTTKPAGQGTGLGLAQVYGIVKQHDGHIDVISKHNVGTSFFIYFPALSIHTEEPSKPEPLTQYRGEGQTIMIVEDDRNILEAMRTLLISQGYEVLTAANGVEAMQLIEDGEKPVSLVVSDIVMPEMGGIALHKALKNRFPKIKMLFLTGHPAENESRTLLEKGEIKWMQKPFSVSEFNQLVADLLEKP